MVERLRVFCHVGFFCFWRQETFITKGKSLWQERFLLAKRQDSNTGSVTMASTMFADQKTKKMTAVRPTPVWEAGADQVIEAGIRTRTATRTASITRIETLLDKVDDPVLADLWRQICPLDVEQLPDRQGIIADLADFAEVLQPRLNGMQAPQLCRLIEAYAAKHRRSQRFVRTLLWDVNAGQSRVVADAQPGVRLEHDILDVGSVVVGV